MPRRRNSPQLIVLDETTLDYDTGLKSTNSKNKTIVEALKVKDINNIDNNNLILINGRDNLIKFRQFY